MCGIHGFTWRDTDKSLDCMTEAARHRGPNGTGAFGNDHITLGHNLLAITEAPNKSAQPWHHNNHVLVFNGEIYNYRDLRKILQHKCVTDADTEVLAAGLFEHGLDFLKHVDGMYALAWYAIKEQQLTLARDVNGAKPLYCSELRGQLAFSSEIRSLLAIGSPAIVSQEGFRHYYHAGLVTGPLTLFRGIHRVVPGQAITFKLDNKTTTQRNFVQAPAIYTGKPKHLPQMLRDSLREGVEKTYSPRVPTGLFLSGGMDSAAIYHEILQAKQYKPRSFTTRFVIPHDRCNHNSDADAAAALTTEYNTEHHEVLVGEQDWVDDFENAVLAMEEPRQGKSHAAYYACNRAMAKLGCVVTKSGDGGDELLRGYKHQLNTSYEARVDSLRPARLLRNEKLQLSLHAQMAYLYDWIPKAGLTQDAGNDFMFLESMTSLAEDFLIRSDKLGAAFSMEARFPMLCNTFRNLCRSIPSELKIKHSAEAWSFRNKYLLRQAYQDCLPAVITKKEKTGWRAPTDDWIIGITSHPAKDGPVRQYVREVLQDKQIRELFEITEDDVENRYLNNRDFVGPPKASGKPSVGPGLSSQKELFSILSFAVWFKKFNMRLW